MYTTNRNKQRTKEVKQGDDDDLAVEEKEICVAFHQTGLQKPMTSQYYCCNIAATRAYQLAKETNREQPVSIIKLVWTTTFSPSYK